MSNVDTVLSMSRITTVRVELLPM